MGILPPSVRLDFSISNTRTRSIFFSALHRLKRAQRLMSSPAWSCRRRCLWCRAAVSRTDEQTGILTFGRSIQLAPSLEREKFRSNSRNSRPRSRLFYAATAASVVALWKRKIDRGKEETYFAGNGFSCLIFLGKIRHLKRVAINLLEARAHSQQRHQRALHFVPNNLEPPRALETKSRQSLLIFV